MRGQHRSVACQRCHHATPGARASRCSARSSRGKAPAGKHGERRDRRLRGVPLLARPALAAGGRLARATASTTSEHKIACVRCHAASMHGFEPDRGALRGAATPATPWASHGMEGMHCFACHEFLGDEPGLRPTRRDCLRCHTAQGIHAPRERRTARRWRWPARPATGRTRAAGETLVACTSATTPRAIARARAPRRRRGHGRCVDCHPAAHLDGGAGGLRALPRARAGPRARPKACTACHSFAGAPAPARRRASRVAAEPSARDAPAQALRPHRRRHHLRHVRRHRGRALARGVARPGAARARGRRDRLHRRDRRRALGPRRTASTRAARPRSPPSLERLVASAPLDRAWIVDRDGQGRSPASRARAEPLPGGRPARRSSSSPTRRSRRSRGSSSREGLVASAPVLRGGAVVGAVRVDFTHEEVVGQRPRPRVGRERRRRVLDLRRPAPRRDLPPRA